MNRIFFTAILIAFAFSSCKNNVPEEISDAFSMSDTMLAKCEFHTCEIQDLKNEIRFFGKITSDNNKTAQVYPIVGGNVLEIKVELGDYVKEGQTLAIIRSSEVANFQKEKLDAQSNLAVAEKNLQVARDMFAGKLTSEKDVIAAEKEMDKAKAELDRINEIYSIYSLKTGSIYYITAPISGFIVSKSISPNEQLRADKSDEIFSIAEINEVWALANVNESDISKVKIGYDAEVKTLSFPDETYKGKVDKMFNAIDPETKSMKVRVKIPNKDFKLKPEMNATVTVRYTEPEKMSAVPSSSVIFDKNKYWVMVFKDRHNVETRRVKVFRQLNDITYLSEGIEPGERVISKNGLFVYDALND